MTVYHVKSTPITNLDLPFAATPGAAQASTAGQGAGSVMRVIDAYATPTASAGIDSTIQLVRVPSAAVIKVVEFQSGTQDTTGMFDLGVYYATDGSNALSVTGGLLAAAAIDQDIFTITSLDAGGNQVYARLVPGGGIRVTNTTPAIDANTVWTAALAYTPLWSALGLTSDPGGNFDIVATITEAPGAATVPIYCRVEYSY